MLEPLLLNLYCAFIIAEFPPALTPVHIGVWLGTQEMHVDQSRSVSLFSIM